jgi:hypothetical protein
MRWFGESGRRGHNWTRTICGATRVASPTRRTCSRRSQNDGVTKLERSEDVPDQCVLESVVDGGGGRCRGPLQAVGMMRGDHEPILVVRCRVTAIDVWPHA